MQILKGIIHSWFNTSHSAPTPDEKKFQGISIYITKYMPRGSGIALPPIGIFIGKDSPDNIEDTKQHEYGHYLQYKELGFWKFYLKAGIPSLRNAIQNRRYYKKPNSINKPIPHKLFYIETDANKRAVNYFGKYQKPQNFPT